MSKADPDMQDVDGHTALMNAIELGVTDMVKLLLKYRASIEITNKRGWNPLHMAVLKENVPILEILINELKALYCRVSSDSTGASTPKAASLRPPTPRSLSSSVDPPPIAPSSVSRLSSLGDLPFPLPTDSTESDLSNDRPSGPMTNIATNQSPELAALPSTLRLATHPDQLMCYTGPSYLANAQDTTGWSPIALATVAHDVRHAYILLR